MIRIRIPATSANLGAGFDSLGLAVNLYNTLDMAECDRVEISTAKGPPAPATRRNLVYSSAERLYELCGRKLPGLRIVQTNRIPMTRGLGSSSACIVGGLVGANVLLGAPCSKSELVDIAAQLEGHPDNTTPALLGGIVTAVLEGERVYWVKQEVANALRLTAIVPDFRVSTREARRALPAMVRHADARFNLSRAALFSASLLQGKYENLRVAVEDRLHQPYRKGFIIHADEVMARAYALGAWAVYISGAGPTLMALADGANAAFAPALREYLAALSLDGWEVRELAVDNVGAIVE